MERTAAAHTRSRWRLIADWFSACVCLVLAAAVTAIGISLAMQPEADPVTGLQLGWWSRAVTLYVRVIPWVAAVAALYGAPVLIWLSGRLGPPMVVLTSVLVGVSPALVLAVVSFSVPSMEMYLFLAFPVAILGGAIALLGTCMWVAWLSVRPANAQPPDKTPPPPNLPPGA